ncbi:GIY-YIG nuclease family protein [Halalkalicoccus subterraneus]|uniref:GIY-YIG nuclease family protein n=1 Tax=Halalkalicoccus subterraneus TaxID=2675002 RepID=UPI000EFAB2C4|nr:GIY-YIG nuclease family protein [Halalkalicoccus subterraneus]
MGGTYTLVIALPEPATIDVGALGTQEFSAGRYAYTGSAFGPGGFSRVDRHRELARGERDTRHWHVDYLLGHPTAAIEAVVRTPEEDVECAVGRTLPDAGIDGFGASDCDCVSHLAYAANGLLDAVERAHRESSDPDE